MKKSSAFLLCTATGLAGFTTAVIVQIVLTEYGSEVRAKAKQAGKYLERARQQAKQQAGKL